MTWRIVRIGLISAAALSVWSALVVAGGLVGVGRWGLVEPGAFMAATRAYAAEHPGNLAVVLIDDNRVAGAHFSSVGRPVDRDTLFQVASVSKWVTAWGVMRLVAEGRIDLDAPIDRYLRRWRLPASRFDRDGVTVRRLLSHNAGLTDGLGYCGFAPGERLQTIEESLTRPADACVGSGLAELGATPGSGWRYSGASYTLLQLLIEEVTGESFAAFMRRAVLLPLGMERSTFDPEVAAGDPNLAGFYDRRGGAAIHYRYTATAAASLYTSAADLARFVQAHLPGPGGEPPGRGVLSPNAVAQMRRPQVRDWGADHWGLGPRLFTADGAGDFIFGHDGGNLPAVAAAVRIDPAHGDAIVALSTGGPWAAGRIGAEWLHPRRGGITALTVRDEALRLWRWLVSGAGVILVGAGVAVWRVWRSGMRASK